MEGPCSNTNTVFPCIKIPKMRWSLSSLYNANSSSGKMAFETAICLSG